VGVSAGDAQYSWLKEVHSTFEMEGIKMEPNFIV
jgi:plant cysteine oxidase